MILIFRLVIRAHNAPTIKNMGFKRKLYVQVSNRETTVKTADVLVEGDIAKWNQKLGTLYVFPVYLQFYG